MKLLVTDRTEKVPIALDGANEVNGSKVNTTTEDEEEIANPLRNCQQPAS